LPFNRVRLLLGLTSLGFGVLVYAFDRPADQVYFLPDALHVPEQLQGSFGLLGQHLPTFLHVLAFCLLTAAFLPVKTRGALVICSTWLLIDAAFEAAQHAAIAPWAVRALPDWFARVPVLENTAAYFRNGRFDPIDLLSIGLGALLGLLLILVTRRFDPKVASSKTSRSAPGP